MKKITTALFAAAALLASSGAMAQAYVGGALGLSSLDGACDGADIPCDEDDTGFKIFGGYKFTPNIAIEGSYVDFGKASASEPGWSASVAATSFGVGVAGFYDFNSVLTGVGRIGLASNQAKAQGGGLGLSYSESESNVKPYFGLALGFKVARGLRIEGGIDFTSFELEGEDFNARLISVGVRYEF